MALSFATDIKPMFTAMDQDHMLNQQGMFNLWDYNDVKTNASAILGAVKSGRMPRRRMCSNDLATVGAEIPIFFAVRGIETMGLRCMCWKTRRTEAAGRPRLSICR